MKRLTSTILVCTCFIVGNNVHAKDDDFLVHESSEDQVVEEFADNCSKKKKKLNRKFDKCRFSTCWVPDKTAAKVLGVELGAELVRDGYARGLTVGATTVKHWSGPVTWPSTYMGYACGNES